MNRDKALLEDLLELVQRVQASVAGKSLEAFTADQDCYDANAFRLAAIGESTGRLSDELKGRHPEMGWRAMIGFRNVVSHDYFGISPDYVWAALHDLDRLKSVCSLELSRIEQDEQTLGLGPRR